MSRAIPPTRVLWLAVPALLAAACVIAPGYRVGRARIVGATEVFRVTEAGLDFVGRIDTGARASSLHTVSIEVEGDAGEMIRNAGKRVRFTVVNEKAERRALVAVIEDVAEIRSAHGSELRYRVPLHIGLRGDEREVLVSLRDRSLMTHKLLVGRDWIRDDYLVDVGRNATDD